MKLAFCLFKYFPFGGLQRDFLRIAQLALTRGHEVHIYTQTWQGPLDAKFHLHLIHVNALQNHNRNWQFVQQVSKQLPQQHFDVVIGFNKMPNLDIYYAADRCYQARLKCKPFFYRWLPRARTLISLEQSVFDPGLKTQILLIAPREREVFRQYYQTPTQRFHFLPPGIAKDRIAPPDAAIRRAQLHAQYGVNPHEKIILFIGSSFATKGLDRVIKGMAALPQSLGDRTSLWVLGQDDPNPYKMLARHLQVSGVQFLGGRDNVPDYLLAADLLVHPAYLENTGTVLLEALASGLPVLTVNECGYAHYIEQAQAGVVLPSPFNQSIFNEQLANMLTSKTLSSWRENGIRFATTQPIYSLPECALNKIEEVGHHRHDLFAS